MTEAGRPFGHGVGRRVHEEDILAEDESRVLHGAAVETTVQEGWYASLVGHALANGDLEIGLRIGRRLNPTSPVFFSRLGVGWRY